MDRNIERQALLLVGAVQANLHAMIAPRFDGLDLERGRVGFGHHIGQQRHLFRRYNHPRCADGSCYLRRRDGEARPGAAAAGNAIAAKE
jgi:hypothetical protein